MLRIACRGNGHGSTTTLVLEGRLTGPWVNELRDVCERRGPGSAARLVLDLRAVTFIDREGIELLRSLTAGRYADVTNCSPFVAEQLRAAMAR